ncbi:MULTISPECIES: proteophosphoglycan 5 [unclassified Saccharothrix]|uniref:proteophosphoglycan 5 n=1 Tax=unclassified Saccharothrix TaxID=2593673 RepID=UPI00307EA62E
MGLVELDLPDPLRLRGRWAAFAAVCAARGWGDNCHADGHVWHYDDGGGNWADLHHLGGGRALLLGHDHEYSETYYANAAEYFEEEETDLLAGAPEWWYPPVRAVIDEGRWVGFAYGFEDGRWHRAPYDLDDGFDSVNLPALDTRRCHELITDFIQDAPQPNTGAIDALIAADGEVTEAHLAAVVGPTGWDVAAGVAAARRFREA